MSTVVIDLLKHELEQQKGKLDALKDHHQHVIEDGRRSQQIVDQQARHVGDLSAAIGVLERDARRSEIPVES